MTATTDAAASLEIPRLAVWVPGRPAPKGSHKLGEHGQVRDASAYLAAWAGTWSGRGRNRHRLAGAVERAVYSRYAELGVQPERLPIFRGPIGVNILFAVPWDPATTPDGDKLERATWDALTVARVWEDDARVVAWSGKKVRADESGPGAYIIVWAVTP